MLFFYTVVMSFLMVFPWGFHHHLAWEDPARHSRRDCANYGGWFQGMGSHPQVQPCCSLLWIVFPVGLESFWDLQLSVSTVGMGLAFLQWSLNLWGDSSCAELCCSTSCEERCADSSNKNHWPPLHGITEGHDRNLAVSNLFPQAGHTLHGWAHGFESTAFGQCVGGYERAAVLRPQKQVWYFFVDSELAFGLHVVLVYVFFVFWF